MSISFDEEKQKRKLDEFRKKEEEDLAQIVASRNGLEYADLGPVPINMDALRTIPEALAREAKAAAFSLVGKKVKVGILSPAHPKIPEVEDHLSRHGLEATFAVISNDSLEKAWTRYADLSYSTETKAGALDISSEDIKGYLSSLKTIEDVKKGILEITKLKKGFRISKILEIVLAGSLALKASDVHIEPEEGYVRLRYRLDGVLTDIALFDHETFALLLSRIKLLSGLKLNVKSEAQDGRFSVKITDLDIEIRTSVLPGAYSESVVLRLLDPRSIQVKLEELGIPNKLLELIMREIAKPNGMVLTTGPTGSGKTTTLYAFLRKIHNPGVKIITIEDPIEYHLPGIVQTQVNERGSAANEKENNNSIDQKGYTFLSGLRSALRQDPDVIMVGEIRDEETAEIAVNASLTGHLVFSTLHTNSAAGAYPRLIDLEVNPKVLTSAINVSLAQRLLRKLCPQCKVEGTITGNAKAIVEKTLSSIVDKNELEHVQTEKMWVAKGCAECHNTGYRGRIGIFEAVFTDEGLEKVLKGDPSEREIKEATKHQGILSMKQDGILKVLKGVTSLDELNRVIDIETAE